MEILIIVGALLLLVWLFLYFRYFRENTGSNLHHEGEEMVYSVAPWGDDNNSGSLTHPWKTLQKAIDNLQPGESLLIREGIYKEHISLNKSGTEENPIVIGVFQGEEAALEGDGAGWKYGVNFEHGISFVTLSGLKVKNFRRHGVALWGENQSVQLKDLEVHGCGTGLHIISAVDLLVQDCDFHNNSGTGLVVSPGPLKSARILRTRSSYNDGPGQPDGFALDSGEGILIEKCSAEYNTGSGFRCFTSNTTISAGTVRDNGGYGIKCFGEDYKLVNCIIDGCGMAGVVLQGGGMHKLYNNLIINCGCKGDYGLLAAPGADALPARVSLVNNILAYNYGGVFFDNFAILEKEDHNIYWSREDAEISNGNRNYSRCEINRQTWFDETGKGEHSFCRDPLFVDPSCRDFRLAKNSPAIDRGTREGAPGTDIDGSVRPRGRGIDIGPYESAEGSLIPPTAAITYCPVYSSETSNSLKFSVKWAGFIEEGEVAGFNVQFKDGVGGTWQNWLADTTESEGAFLGVGGRTYYFRVRARDDLGNWGNWSAERYTEVPVDDRSPLIKYEGEWHFINSEEAYMGTLHHSDSPGALTSFRLTGTEVAWISTQGPDRGQALVYIDRKLQAAVDLYSKDWQCRAVVFSTSLDGMPHTIQIEVAETKNRLSKGSRVDVDGFAIKS